MDRFRRLEDRRKAKVRRKTSASRIAESITPAEQLLDDMILKKQDHDEEERRRKEEETEKEEELVRRASPH